MKIASFLPKALSFVMLFLIAISNPLLNVYHKIKQSTFVNSTLPPENLALQYADLLLTPAHYLFGANKLSLDPKTGVEKTPRFKYQQNLTVNHTLATHLLTPSLVFGLLTKKIALLWECNNEQYRLFKTAIKQRKVKFSDYGIHDLPHLYSSKRSSCQNIPRETNAEEQHKVELEALQAIVQHLEKSQIPYFLDCGTCLGAYRHGGIIPWDHDVDLGILEADHDNVLIALKELDPKKYVVQDWSSYKHPKTYLRIFLKQMGNHIDLYHYRFDKEKKELAYFFSLKDSRIMPKRWRMREEATTKPLAYNVIFPLKRARFDGINVYVPNQIKTFLESKYGANLSPSRIWDEKQQKYVRIESHPYWKQSDL